MPRSGNTLFASIMNQNPDLVVTSNSIVLEILKALYYMKQSKFFKNFPDEQSFNNVMNSVFDCYYKNWDYKIILDRSPACTPGNLMILQKHFRRPVRCVVILRDLLDVLASYIKMFETHENSFFNRYKTLDEKLTVVMHNDGAVAKELRSIKYLLHHPEMALFIKYDDLVVDPEKELRKVYTFLNLPYFSHKFIDLDQLTINGIQYNDDHHLGGEMHTIRTDKIMKVENPYKAMIPERFVKEYGHIRF